MTSRHTRDEPRWGWAPARGPLHADSAEAGAADSVPVPESISLPSCLDEALRVLVGGSGGTVSFNVSPDPESVTAARHFATCTLHDWNLGALSEDVALVVTELVTNALRHSVPAHCGPLDPGQPNSDLAGIRLRLIDRDPWLLCGILDGSSQAPRRREPDYVAETGRGLHLVECFTVHWGWRSLAGQDTAAGGKIVWALFRRPEAA